MKTIAGQLVAEDVSVRRLNIEIQSTDENTPDNFQRTAHVLTVSVKYSNGVFLYFDCNGNQVTEVQISQNLLRAFRTHVLTSIYKASAPQ